jgi:hypothetical protein
LEFSICAGIFSCLGNKCIFWTEAGYVGGLPSQQKLAADKPATGGPYKSFAVDISYLLV